MEPKRTTTNDAEEMARDAAEATGAIPYQQEPEKSGFVKRFLKWLSRGSQKLRDERNIVSYLTAPALMLCQVGRATMEKRALK